jgi:nucleoid DNA-binding protein
MNKTEFVKKLSEELNITQTAASKNLEAVMKCVTEALKEHDELRFVGFGTFKGRQVAAKEVKTPKGIMAMVPAQRRVSFSVGSEFKATVNGK